MAKESEWVDYGMLLDEIHMHRRNAQRQINEYREKGKERDLTKSEYGLYNEEIGKEIALMCLERWCMDFKFSISEIKEMEDNMIQAEKKLPEGLEEAAEEYNKQVIEETKCHHNALTYAEGYEDALLLIPDAFIAGAEWQKEQDQKIIELAEDHAMLAGMNKMEQQMLEKAVEGEVVQDLQGVNRVKSFGKVPEWLHFGDKVKLIIVKEDQK